MVPVNCLLQSIPLRASGRSDKMVTISPRDWAVINDTGTLDSAKNSREMSWSLSVSCLKLDDTTIEEMSIWVRGRSTAPFVHRTLAHPIRGETSEIATFNRLALITRTVDEANVQVRLFKDIPIRDVEALLPNASVRMGPRDAVVMAGSGVGAVWALVTKILAVGLAAAGQLLWVVAVPLAGLSWKMFSGYRRAIKNRDSNRARHLYTKSLGANRSAIHRISGGKASTIS